MTAEMAVDGMPKGIAMPQGAGQGSTLGPRLFAFFMLAILDLFHARFKANDATTGLLYKPDDTMTGRDYRTTNGQWTGSYMFGFAFADDTAIIFETKDQLETNASLLVQIFERLGLGVHTKSRSNPKSKTQAMFMPADNQLLSDPPLPDLALSLPTHLNEDCDRTIPFTDQCVYLGYLLHHSLRDDHAIEARITSANQLFGSMRRELLCARVANNEVERTIFVGMILAMLLYGAEGWVVSSHMLRRLQTTYRRWARAMCRVNLRTTRIKRTSTSTLLQQMGIQDIQYYLDQRVLGWAGHVARMNPDCLPRKLLTSYLDAPRKAGGQALAHGRTLRKALQRKEISVTGWMKRAQDRSDYRTLGYASPPVLLPTYIAKALLYWRSLG